MPHHPHWTQPLAAKHGLLLLIALALSLHATAASGAVLEVTSVEDGSDAVPGDGVVATADGLATLRAAVEEANALPGPDEVVLQMAPGSAVVVTDTCIEVTDDLTLTSSLQDAQIASYEEQWRMMNSILCVAAPVKLMMSDVSFERIPPSLVDTAVHVSPGGLLQVRRCRFTGSGRDRGGAIHAIDAQVTMEDCLFENCHADYGGAVAMDGANSVLSAFRCQFTGNQAGSGGAIGIEGEATFVDCSIWDNCAISDGGAVYASGTVFFANCTFVHNVAYYGGGLALWNSDATLLNCTLTGNNQAAIYGGFSMLRLGNCIIAGNCAQEGRPYVSCVDTCIRSDQDINIRSSSTILESLGNNIIGVGESLSGFLPSDQVGGSWENPLDARLGPLGDYGGNLPSVPLLPDSPAINAGSNSLVTNPPFDGPPFYDIRGEVFLRIVNGAVDIGAFEVQLDDAQRHSADYDGDGQIALNELLRLIQYYNLEAYHCDASTEDGYAPGSGESTCSPHESDYWPQDWSINLSEILRAIQFFNTGGYHACPDTASEDGFCAGRAVPEG